MNNEISQKFSSVTLNFFAPSLLFTNEGDSLDEAVIAAFEQAVPASKSTYWLIPATSVDISTVSLSTMVTGAEMMRSDFNAISNLLMLATKSATPPSMTLWVPLVNPFLATIILASEMTENVTINVFCPEFPGIAAEDKMADPKELEGVGRYKNDTTWSIRYVDPSLSKDEFLLALKRSMNSSIGFFDQEINPCLN